MNTYTITHLILKKKLLCLIFRIHDLRRDIQARIGSRTNIIGSAVDNYGGETFLSEEVAMNILQDSKKAFDRCQLVRICETFNEINFLC